LHTGALTTPQYRFSPSPKPGIFPATHERKTVAQRLSPTTYYQPALSRCNPRKNPLPSAGCKRGQRLRFLLVSAEHYLAYFSLVLETNFDALFTANFDSNFAEYRSLRFLLCTSTGYLRFRAPIYYFFSIVVTIQPSPSPIREFGNQKERISWRKISCQQEMYRSGLYVSVGKVSRKKHVGRTQKEHEILLVGNCRLEYTRRRENIETPQNT
jgi:hypothetical protein